MARANGNGSLMLFRWRQAYAATTPQLRMRLQSLVTHAHLRCACCKAHLCGRTSNGSGCATARSRASSSRVSSTFAVRSYGYGRLRRARMAVVGEAMVSSAALGDDTDMTAAVPEGRRNRHGNHGDPARWHRSPPGSQLPPLLEAALRGGG